MRPSASNTVGAVFFESSRYMCEFRAMARVLRVDLVLGIRGKTAGSEFFFFEITTIRTRAWHRKF